MHMLVFVRENKINYCSYYLIIIIFHSVNTCKFNWNIPHNDSVGKSCANIDYYEAFGYITPLSLI